MSQTVISLLAIGVYITACSKKETCHKTHTVKCHEGLYKYGTKIYNYRCECHPPYGGYQCDKSE